jgi:hypothetical protein
MSKAGHLRLDGWEAVPFSFFFTQGEEFRIVKPSGSKKLVQSLRIGEGKTVKRAPAEPQTLGPGKPHAGIPALDMTKNSDDLIPCLETLVLSL